MNKLLENNALLIHKTGACIEYGELPALMIDRPRLYDIFNILLDNALHYCRPDCIPKIRIHGESKNGRIFYYVQDNGIGIPAEYRERVFLVFERLQVNRNQDSTGIGLAIVRRIVENCGGTVYLTGTVGGGTTVVFNLPAKTELTPS
jgi:light-regulated signal transduction histidine kinase (bacteriophytochrome)